MSELAPDPAPKTVRVEVASAWSSKIIWTAAVSVAASWLAKQGLNLDADTQLQIVLAIQSASAGLIWIFRTWFNRRVSPASL